MTAVALRVRRSPGFTGVLWLVAALYVLTLGALLLWTLVPMLVGWSPRLIVSESMAPRLPAGSVLMVAAAGDPPQPGDIVVVRDPAAAGGALAHRLVRREPGGALVLRGDANRTEDAPVPASALLGQGRMVVPLVGLPVLWARDGHLVALGLWLVITSAAISVTASAAGRWWRAR